MNTSLQLTGMLPDVADDCDVLASMVLRPTFTADKADKYVTEPLMLTNPSTIPCQPSPTPPIPFYNE